MQELVISVKQRVSRIRSAIQQSFSQEQMRSLKQQEKLRCQKQGFIMSMMRSCRIGTVSIKKAYYHYSLELMKCISQDFVHEASQITEQSFLNDFVGLYTTFFSNFQNKLNFKTSVRNFLRPTNHNLVFDLIKYLVDFTRDYYTQTLFWKTKNSGPSFSNFTNVKEKTRFSAAEIPLSNSVASQKSEQQNADICFRQRYKHDLQKPINSNRKINKQSLTLDSCSTYEDYSFTQRRKPLFSISTKQTGIHDSVVQFKQPTRKDYYNQSLKLKIPEIQNPVKNEVDSKAQVYNIYDLLDLSPLPQIKALVKEHAQTEVVKIRINQLYREQKSRNLMIKQGYQSFYEAYQFSQQKGSQKKENPNKEKLDMIDLAILPYRLNQTFQKNGFSIINVEYDSKYKKIYKKPTLNGLRFFSASGIFNGVQSTKVSQNSKILPFRANGTLKQINETPKKKQPLLTSMKILRVSDNFLPSLMNIPKQKPENSLNPEREMYQRASFGQLSGNQLQKNYSSKPKSKLKLQIDQCEKRAGSQVKYLMMEQNQTEPDFYDHELMQRFPSFNPAPCFSRKNAMKQSIMSSRYKSPNQKMKTPKFATNAKLKSKRNQEKYGIREQKAISKKDIIWRQKGYKNSDEKILEWLDKIKNLKDLERRKILGMN